MSQCAVSLSIVSSDSFFEGYLYHVYIVETVALAHARAPLWNRAGPPTALLCLPGASSVDLIRSFEHRVLSGAASTLSNGLSCTEQGARAAHSGAPLVPSGLEQSSEHPRGTGTIFFYVLQKCPRPVCKFNVSSVAAFEKIRSQVYG